ncbi:hypothetical protein ACCS96_00625 [Rhizobium ruizarguesonis]
MQTFQSPSGAADTWDGGIISGTKSTDQYFSEARLDLLKYDAALCASSALPLILAGFMAPPLTPLVELTAAMGLVGCIAVSIATVVPNDSKGLNDLKSITGIFTPEGLYLGTMGAIYGGKEWFQTGADVGAVMTDARGLFGLSESGGNFVEHASEFMSRFGSGYLLNEDADSLINDFGGDELRSDSSFEEIEDTFVHDDWPGGGDLEGGFDESESGDYGGGGSVDD